MQENIHINAREYYMDSVSDYVLENVYFGFERKIN